MQMLHLGMIISLHSNYMISAHQRTGNPLSRMQTFRYQVRYIQEYDMINNYRNNLKFSDRYAWANSADPDQTALFALGAV